MYLWRYCNDIRVFNTVPVCIIYLAFSLSVCLPAESSHLYRTFVSLTGHMAIPPFQLYTDKYIIHIHMCHIFEVYVYF